MIPQDVLRAFSRELYKEAAAATAAKMSRKMKAALVAGGAGLGGLAGQIKDDAVQGGLDRRQRARAQGIHPLLT